MIEVVTGLALLFAPAVPLELLLGVRQSVPETMLVSRVAGAALLALGIASWCGGSSDRNPALLGLLAGLLAYDASVAAILVYAAVDLNLDGVALWPAVVLHSVMAAWCGLCLSSK